VIIQTTNTVEAKVRGDSKRRDVGESFPSHATKASWTRGYCIRFVRLSHMSNLGSQTRAYSADTRRAFIIAAIVSNQRKGTLRIRAE
jgi:hypothetical protein